MYKTVCTPTSLYCKFCKSVGHDEKDCEAYQLMGNKMVDAYLMNTEEQVNIEQTPLQFQASPQFQATLQFPSPQQF